MFHKAAFQGHYFPLFSCMISKHLQHYLGKFQISTETCINRSSPFHFFCFIFRNVLRKCVWGCSLLVRQAVDRCHLKYFPLQVLSRAFIVLLNIGINVLLKLPPIGCFCGYFHILFLSDHTLIVKYLLLSTREIE